MSLKASRERPTTILAYQNARREHEQLPSGRYAAVAAVQPPHHLPHRRRLRAARAIFADVDLPVVDDDEGDGVTVQLLSGGGEFNFRILGSGKPRMSKDYLVVQCFGELGRRADDDGRAVVAPLVRALLLIFHLFNVRDVALHIAQTTDLRMKNLYLNNSETLLSLHCTA